MFLGARHNAHSRIELLGGNDDHQITRVIASHRKQPACADNVGTEQKVVVGSVALQIEQAGKLLQVVVKTCLLRIDGDEMTARVVQFVCGIASNPPETTNDIVMLQLPDTLFHPSSPQGIIKVLLEKEHGQAGKKKGQHAQTGYRNQAGKKTRTKGAERHDFAITHG